MAGKVDILRKLNYIWNILLWWVSWPPSLCDYQLNCSRELWEKMSAPSHQKPKWVFVLTWSSLCTWTDPPLNWLNSVTVHWLRPAVLFCSFPFCLPLLSQLLKPIYEFSYSLGLLHWQSLCSNSALLVFFFFFLSFLCFLNVCVMWVVCDRIKPNHIKHVCCDRKIMFVSIFRKLETGKNKL